MTGTDEAGDVVDDDDDADTVLNPPGCTVNCGGGGGGCTSNCTEEPPHPGIAINKSGPATANAGDVIPYLLDVTNTGDQPFDEAKVVLTDPLCGATPTLSSKNGDQSPAQLNPNETWTYTCSVPTAAGQTFVHNVGSVTGIPPKGPPVSATDFADTTLAVAGSRAAASGCLEAPRTDRLHRRADADVCASTAAGSPGSRSTWTAATSARGPSPTAARTSR